MKVVEWCASVWRQKFFVNCFEALYSIQCYVSHMFKSEICNTIVCCYVGMIGNWNCRLRHVVSLMLLHLGNANMMKYVTLFALLCVIKRFRSFTLLSSDSFM